MSLNIATALSVGDLGRIIMTGVVFNSSLVEEGTSVEMFLYS